MATRFSFIHLSDFHFCLEPNRSNALVLLERRPRAQIDTVCSQIGNFGLLSLMKPASYVPDIVAGVAQFCFERSEVIDGIIVTGDAATTGKMNDIGPAYAFIADKANSGFLSKANAPTINIASLPIYVMPGNHDRYSDDFGKPNCKNFELKFSDFMKNYKTYENVGHFVRRKVDSYIGFVYADFCLLNKKDAEKSPIAFYGQGKVYSNTITALEARTHYLRNKYKGIALVWAIHFAPFECGERLKLLDWEVISQKASALRVTATLCGHTHKAKKVVTDQHTIYCAGSAGCIDSENDSRVHIIHFDVSEKPCVTIRENYIWDYKAHEFIFKSTD